MMTFEELKHFIESEPLVEGSLTAAAGAATAARSDTSKTFDPLSTAAGLAVLVICFPILNRVVRRIGLPWLHSIERYAELWRMEFERWIDEEYHNRGFDPDAAKAAGESLRRELEKTTDSAARKAWERLLALLRQGDAQDKD